MNNLMEIINMKIGAENVNSVNSRELYDSLGLAKGQYSRWIKSNLLDIFNENFDYIGVRQDVEGNPVLSYIVTLDVAKHLSMMSKTDKAMEFRNYFIEVEKQSQKVLTLPEQIALLAQGNVEQEKRLSIVESKIDNEILLTSAQKLSLRNNVSKKVYTLKDSHDLPDTFIRKGFMQIWKILKRHFAVSSYMEIPKVKFEEAHKIVDNISMGDLI